jgi:hypothetical protein
VAEEGSRRDTAKIAEAEALISQVGETLKNAKKAEELDALMLALSKSKISEYNNNPKLQAISRQLQSTLQIVGNWQEYLIAEETGNSQTRRSHLQQISSQLATTPILPRSIVLRLLNLPVSDKPQPAAQQTVVARVSLDGYQSKLTESGDSAAILAELKAIPEEALRNSDNSSFLRIVQMLEDLRMLEPAMSEAEVFANIRSLQNNTQNRFTFNRAIDQIALNALARSYGIETPSAKTTSASKVLEAIAATNKDWQKLRMAINSLDALGSNAYGTDRHKRINDLKILSLLELGAAAEKRNDLEGATSAYIEASSLDGQYLQRAVAYGKIANLKQQAPEKVTALMAKAEEARERAAIVRQTTERDMQERMMMNRGMPTDRLRREDLTAMKPMVQEVVAEFLKEKRLEAPKAAEEPKKPQP